MAINSVNSNNNIYNAIFADSAYQSNNTGGMSWLFGGQTSNILGDYSMIKSGMYKKLLNAYYTTTEGEEETSSDSKKQTTAKTQSISGKDMVADTTRSLIATRSDASALSKSAANLSNKKLYEATGKDDKGNDTYNREGIEKAVKKFVSDYNSYIKTAGNVNGQSILKKTVDMTNAAYASSQTLKEAGITLKSDNSLEVDTEKLGSAKMSTLISLFTGKGSFGNSIQNMSKSVYQMANSTVYSNSYGSSYSSSGSYSMMGSKSSSTDQYL